MAKQAENPEQAVSEIEAALRSMESLASKPAPAGKQKRPAGAPSAPKSWNLRAIPGATFRWLVAIVVICSLPLLVLVRLSVWFYSAYAVWPWISVLAGALAAATVLIILSLVLIRVATGSIRSTRYFKRVVFGLVLAYCSYSALFISATNTKTEQIRSAYTSLHPSLRIALSVCMLADPQLVITDAEREVEDYARMGLPLNEESLHLVTRSGYVHAVDLRTIGRPEWRNFLATIYFKSMGFRTLRHTGTADHLHVSLPVRE